MPPEHVRKIIRVSLVMLSTQGGAATLQHSEQLS